MKNKIHLLFLAFLFVQCSPTGEQETPPKEPAPKPGLWRGELTHDSGKKIPFLFTLQVDSPRIILQNGQERLPLADAHWNGDSLHAPLHIFDAMLKAKLPHDSLMVGQLARRSYGESSSLPFEAIPANTRFPEALEKSPTFNFEGQWKVKFQKDSLPAVGEFRQEGNKVLGTFRTLTGDYRFLAGQANGNILQLSAFDGSHAFLFTARATPEGTLRGEFFSGKSYQDRWFAERDSTYELPDPHTLTGLKDGEDELHFSFPQADGTKVSPEDFAGQVRIIQLLGTWCPNCMDETAFLAEMQKKYQDKGLQVIGLSYERTKTPEEAFNRLAKLQKRYAVTYPLLYAGKADKDEAAQSLPVLDKVWAFPTTIFIGRDGKVRRIHSGFNGPGTGQVYEKFVADFTRYVETLLAEDAPSEE